MDITLKTDIPGLVLNVHTHEGRGVMSWKRNGEVLIRTFMHPDAVEILEGQFQAELITH